MTNNETPRPLTLDELRELMRAQLAHTRDMFADDPVTDDDFDYYEAAYALAHRLIELMQLSDLPDTLNDLDTLLREIDNYASDGVCDELYDAAARFGYTTIDD